MQARNLFRAARQFQIYLGHHKRIKMEVTYQHVSDLFYRNRYASLYFAACIDKNDNELIVLDIIHHFVEVLDRYFSNVCELDLIFNFHQAYFILEEMIIGGFIMESSKKQALKMIGCNDALMDEAFFKEEGSGKEGGPAAATAKK